MPGLQIDIALLYRSLEVAKLSSQKGNLPFGCLLADNEGRILLEAENAVITGMDSIAHCEINLVHQLAGKYETDFLNHCTVYASTEPCPMCAGAIFWSGIGRLVYAMSKETFHQLAGTQDPAHFFDIPAKELITYGRRKVEVIGPLLENEASVIYRELLQPIP